MTALRYTLTCALLSECCALSGAPVPKQPPPKALTADMLVGTWHYSWNQWPDGVISFDKSGSYTAVHVPGGDCVYFGSWVVKDDAVVISEYRHDLNTNAVSGPTEYRFQFAAKDYPRLKGTSNGAGHVALTKPKG